jgi:hypothetical protein
MVNPATQEINESHFQQLFDFVIEKARVQLERKDSFYPFGAVVDDRLSVQSLDGHWSDDEPVIEELIQKLEVGGRAAIQLKGFPVVIIAVDVMVDFPSENPTEKRAAVEMRMFALDQLHKFYSLYEKRNNEYVFGELSPVSQLTPP